MALTRHAEIGKVLAKLDNDPATRASASHEQLCQAAELALSTDTSLPNLLESVANPDFLTSVSEGSNRDSLSGSHTGNLVINLIKLAQWDYVRQRVDAPEFKKIVGDIQARVTELQDFLVSGAGQR